METVSLLKDRNNPHVLGTTAREVFFLEDGVILVEGQEDVLDYPLVAEQLGIEIPGAFYGWGVGGVTKMGTIAQILSDLGFRRVVGILDQGQEDVLRALQKKFPDYPFGVIPARDIRTKKPSPARARVEGVLDGDGVVRNEYRDGMHALLGDISLFFREGLIRAWAEGERPTGRLTWRPFPERPRRG